MPGSLVLFKCSSILELDWLPLDRRHPGHFYAMNPRLWKHAWHRKIIVGPFPGCRYRLADVFMVTALDRTPSSSLISVACALSIVCGMSEPDYNVAKVSIVAFCIWFAVHLWNAARLYCPRCYMEHAPQRWWKPLRLVPNVIIASRCEFQGVL